MHFTHPGFLNPTNPVTVNLVGCGGTGSQVLTALARMHISLLELGHTGFQLTVYDDDTITPANKGRQLFADSEVGLYKSVTLINRVNRFFGTDWKAVTARYDQNIGETAMLTVGCVDTVAARFEIAESLSGSNYYYHSRPVYWLDFGNGQTTGQVVLGTVGTIEQPTSNLYEPVGNLPMITGEYGNVLEKYAEDDDTPSCSMAAALEKQDLYINSTLAQMGCSLLWGLFRNGMTDKRGFFLNLKDFRSQPVFI